MKRSLLIIIISLLALVLTILFSEKPLLLNRPGFSKAVYSADKELLRLSLSSDEKYRLWVPLEEISPALIQGTILYEDQHFYSHPGVNPFALVRAFIQTYITGQKMIGGSTITMQLARIRMSLQTRTISGKLWQIFHALQLEWHFSKREILEAYLNLAPYGANIEGAGAASIIYFNKPAKDLQPIEGLSLSLIPQDPMDRALPKINSLNNESQNKEYFSARTGLFARWIKHHPTETQLESQLTLPLQASTRKTLPYFAPHFVDQILQNPPPQSEITTTLDLKLQKLVETQLAQFVSLHTTEGIQNGAVLIVDTKKMAVKALVGSADYFNATILGQVDGTRGKRSPGSALKPFVYALALDESLIHPRSILKDSPASFAVYDPENFDREFLGPIDATSALIRSRNLPAVQLANKLSDGRLYNFIKDAGVSALKDKDFYGLSLVLGGVEVSLQELVTMYGMFANGGKLLPLKFLQNEVPTQSPATNRQLLSTESSFLITQMLAENPRPGEESITAEEKTHPVSWKTGTSFGFRDAWAVGLFDGYILGVWLGNFDGKGNPVFVGREAAGRLFFNIVDAIRSTFGIRNFSTPYPGNVTHVQVCSVSGELPGPHCKSTRDSWFIPGKSPITPCQVHREILIDNKTGLRACSNTSENTHPEVYEFWPSDLLAVFRLAGLNRRTPPKYMPECRNNNEQGIAPEIISPQRGVKYQVRISHLSNDLKTNEQIPLRAVSDADATTLFWFINNEVIGNIKSSETLFWTPPPHAGKYTIRAVDDLGRSDSRELEIEVVE